MDRISHKYLRPPNQIVRNSEFLSSFPFFGGGENPLLAIVVIRWLSRHTLPWPIPPSRHQRPSRHQIRRPTARDGRSHQIRESRADTCVYSSPAKQRKEAHINCAYHNCMWDGRDGDGDGDLLRVVAASGR